MTLQEAKSIARHLGLTLRLLRSGKYRVNFRDGNETTAYYTDDLEDAVNTAVEMAHSERCKRCVPPTHLRPTAAHRRSSARIPLAQLRHLAVLFA
jgi:hypothetical protein